MPNVAVALRSIQSGARMLASEREGKEPKSPSGSRLETTLSCRYFPACWI